MVFRATNTPTLLFWKDYSILKHVLIRETTKTINESKSPASYNKILHLMSSLSSFLGHFKIKMGHSSKFVFAFVSTFALNRGYYSSYLYREATDI